MHSYANPLTPKRLDVSCMHSAILSTKQRPIEFIPLCEPKLLDVQSVGIENLIIIAKKWFQESNHTYCILSMSHQSSCMSTCGSECHSSCVMCWNWNGNFSNKNKTFDVHIAQILKKQSRNTPSLVEDFSRFQLVCVGKLITFFRNAHCYLFELSFHGLKWIHCKIRGREDVRWV